MIHIDSIETVVKKGLNIKLMKIQRPMETSQ